MIKGKSGFWLLIIIFSILSFLLILGGRDSGAEIMKEMDGTMGSMMKRDHASDTTLGSIIAGAIQARSAQHSSTTEEGHHQLPFFMKVIDIGGVALILMVLPLMIGASVVLIIMWI